MTPSPVPFDSGLHAEPHQAFPHTAPTEKKEADTQISQWVWYVTPSTWFVPPPLHSVPQPARARTRAHHAHHTHATTATLPTLHPHHTPCIARLPTHAAHATAAGYWTLHLPVSPPEDMAGDTFPCLLPSPDLSSPLDCSSYNTFISLRVATPTCDNVAPGATVARLRFA